MHILMTTPYPMWPIDSGGAARTFNLAQALVAIGHRVTLLSAGTVPGHLDRGGFQWLSYQDKGTTGHFWNSDFIRRCDAALRSEIDLVMRRSRTSRSCCRV